MIHPTAIIDPSAQIADGVNIGPYCVIGAEVTIDSGCTLEAHVVVSGPTVIGKDNHIYSFANVGAACQDKKYAGEPTKLIIGDRNVIRENATLHRGTVQDQGETIVGNDNLLMVGTHVAHDCVIGNHCILANLTSLAGHVHVGDYAILGGATMVHQFCHVGAHSMSGAGTVVFKDVPAFVTHQGNPAKPYGINSEGLRRRGFSDDQRRTLKQAYKVLYRQGLTTKAALAKLANKQDDGGYVAQLVASVEQSSRGIIR